MTAQLSEVRLDGRPFLCQKNEPLAVCLYRNGVKSSSIGFKSLRSRGFTNLEWWIPERLQSEEDAFLSLYALVDRKPISLESPRTGIVHQLLTRMLRSFMDSEFPHRAMIRKRPFWNLTRWYLRRTLPHPSPRRAKDERVKQTFLETDVLVVGSGIAGVSFALKFKELGGEVVVIEGDHFWGGHAVYDQSIIPGLTKTVRDFAENLVETAKDEGVSLLTDVVFDGFFEDGALGIRLGGLRPDAPMLLKAKFFVFATGLRDLPSLFGNNDLPGHMVASSALKLANYYGVSLGARGVVIGNNEYATRTALQLKKAGSSVTLVTGCETVKGVRNEYLRGLQKEGVQVITGIRKMRAEGRREVRYLTTDKNKIDADFIVSAESWSPALETLGQATMPIGYNAWVGCLLPMHGWYGETANPSVFVIGRSSGILDECASSAFAEATAYHIANKLKLRVGENEAESKLSIAKEALNKRYPENYEAYSRLVGCHERGEVLNEPGYRVAYSEDLHSVFVCLCEDVTLNDLDRAVRVHGFEDIELVKRYTGIGTGKCQGKRCLANAIYAISNLTGKPPSATGIFRQRPMVVTTSLEALEAIEL